MPSRAKHPTEPTDTKNILTITSLYITEVILYAVPISFQDTSTTQETPQTVSSLHTTSLLYLIGLSGIIPILLGLSDTWAKFELDKIVWFEISK